MQTRNIRRVSCALYYQTYNRHISKPAVTIRTPLLTELPYFPDSQHWADRLCHLPYFVFLDSGHLLSTDSQMKTHSPSRWDILSCLPDKVEIDQSCIEQRGGHYQPSETPILETFRDWQICNDSKSELSYPLPFVGGLIGFLSYESNHNRFDLPQKSTGFPETVVGLYSWAIIVDHMEQRSWLFRHPMHPTETRNIVDQAISNPKDSSNKTQQEFLLHKLFEAKTTKAEYLKALNQVHDYILAGDCYQINYTQRFTSQYRGHSWIAYQYLRQQSPAPYSVYFDLGQTSLLSHSPEQFIQIKNRGMTTRPIKGTRRRLSVLDHDKNMKDELLSSTKDKAENVMIVDLLRNDLGQTALAGSVKVTRLCELETFKNVHHLVSTVTATLDHNVTPWDGFLQSFPGGSITGAPKKRAMEIIDELEQDARGPYCGSVYYWSLNDCFDSNILIRTLVADESQISVWGGGGIVADSNPEAEYQESLDKVGPLMRALEERFLQND